MAITKLKGDIVNLNNKEVNIGDKAPEVTIIAHDLSEIKIGNKAQVIAVVPSLDTPVCAEETRKFNEEAVNSDIEVVVVSMDLPFAAGRFCTTEGIENLKVGSDFRNKDFANNYGVLITDGPLQGITCRAIFVTDNKGIVVHKEICKDITDEPNYEAVFAIIKK